MMMTTGLPTIHFSKIKTLRAMLLLALALMAGSLSAQGRVLWQEGGALVRDSTLEYSPVVVPTLDGGAVFVWDDGRNHQQSLAPFAQKLDSAGSRAWPDSGVRALTQRSYSFEISAEGDGAGGVFLSWRDEFGPYYMELNAQHIDSAGLRCWGDNSVVAAGTNEPVFYLGQQLGSDGYGGVIMAWAEEANDGESCLVRVQRVDKSGQARWGLLGRELARDGDGYWWGQVLCLGDSGTLVCWVTVDSNIRAQRIDTSGIPLWQPGGVLVCAEPHCQRGAVLTCAGDGIVVCWSDMRSGNWDIFAQKLGFDGTLQWQPQTGVPVCVMPGFQGGWLDERIEFLRLSSGPGGDVTVGWCDGRDSTVAVYCQRLDSSGNALWVSAGVRVGDVADADTFAQYAASQYGFGLVGDTAGSVVVTWPCYPGPPTWENRAQKLGRLGQHLWGPAGLRVGCTSSCNFAVVHSVSDGLGGTVACWPDLRLGQPYASVYAQRYGDVPPGLNDHVFNPSPVWVSVSPNPSSGFVTVRSAPTGEAYSLEIHDVCGRNVRTLWSRPGGGIPPRTVCWDCTTSRGGRAACGVYVVTLVSRDVACATAVVVIPGSAETK